jgi:hypothetical protein
VLFAQGDVKRSARNLSLEGPSLSLHVLLYLRIASSGADSGEYLSNVVFPSSYSYVHKHLPTVLM